MKNKYNILQILVKVYKYTLKAVPISGVLGVTNYLVQGLFPEIASLIQARMFDAVYSFTHGVDTLKYIIIYGILFVGTYIVVYLLQFISSITINTGIYEKCTNYYNMKIYEKTAALPLISFENVDILNLQNRAKDCVGREILSQIYMSSTIFITSGISIIATISVLAAYNIWFIFISVFSVLPYFIAKILRGKEFYFLKKAQTKKVRKVDYLFGLFHDKQAIKEMRIMGFGDYLARKWTEARDEVNEELWRQNIKDGKSLLLCDILKILGYGLSILFALFLTLNGYISIGVFGACIGAFKSMQESTKAFLIDLGNMPEKVAFANDYFEFLDLNEDQDGYKKIDKIKDSITLSNVNFIYPNSNSYALKDISLTIHKGEKIVILGVNGSGKTTLSKIILNVYPPSQGSIYYDSILSSEVDKRSLYTNISLIQQNFVRYSMSLRENIAISNLDHLHNDELIKQTLSLSGLELSDNLDEQLGREFGGKELSVGQWQKIAIARGLFRESELIILDEPTSALDPVIESEILRQFMEIAKKRTAIIISHRVGLCKLADRIVVMKNGQICEIGTHDRLIKEEGEYKRLYTTQEQWYR